MTAGMRRRLLGEFLGTAFLVAAVLGSGIMASRVSPNDVGLQLLENAAATAAALVAIILAIGPVSGAHLNPVVTLANRFFGGLTNGEAAGYIGAQLAGGAVGAVAANLMFGLRVVELSTKVRSSGGLWFAEVVATFGLLLVIFGVVRSRRASAVPFAVGAYIGGAYFFTASTSFANPAVTLARTLSNSFAGINPSSVPPFVAAQLAGAGLAVLAINVLYPTVRAFAEDVAVPMKPVPRPIADFVPPLVHRFVREEFLARGQSQGGIVKDIPEVLFVCVHNAGRSQMAAALLDQHAQGRVHVRSGGSAPGEHINPAVAEAMAEMGLDLSKAFPKPVTDDAVRAADVVVTMGCGDACPVYRGTRYEDWVLEDPAGKSVEQVRPIRDEIDRRVLALLAGLTSEENANA